jgi:ACR3 family arsenite transporter
MRLSLLSSKNLTWTIPAFMLLGLVYGYFLNPAPLKAAILPMTFVMVYPMMVTLNIKKVFSKGDGKVLTATQLINFLAVPVIGFFVGKLFFPNSPLVIIGILLISLIPTSGMTISWTGFAKGNMPAAVKMTVFGLILGSILTPFYLQALVGATIDIPMLKVFKQIVIVVFLPMFFGFWTQRILIKRFGQDKYQKEIKQLFPPKSIIGVFGIVFIAMALKSRSIVENPTMLLTYLIPLVVLYLVIFSVSTLVGKLFFKRADSIALVYGTVMRNLSIALAIAMAVFKQEGSEIAIIIAMAFIIQVPSAAWFVKYTDRFFGKSQDKQQPSNETLIKQNVA